MFDIVNITGFLPFGGIEVNPTELIINHFREKPHPRLRRIKKLDVTVKDVDTYVGYLSMSCGSKEGRILNLHLGVGGGKAYELETCGYNNKDFRIPDNNGYQCSGEKINGNMQLDQPVNTKVNLNSLRAELQKKGHKVEISTDPGRYICNYIYFSSLQQVNKDNCTSLFVHFPELKDAPHQQNIKFVSDLLDVLTG